MEKLLTTNEAAAALGVRPETLRRWRMQGKGPGYIRLGTSKRAAVRYRRQDVDAWLAGRTFGGTGEEAP